MGKSKPTRGDGINYSNQTQELEKLKNLPHGFYKDGARGSKQT